MRRRGAPDRPAAAASMFASIYGRHVRAAAVLLLLLLAPGWARGPGLAAQEEPGVPFVSTPMDVVRTMLELAGTTSADTVYDLGSGDGRIPIAAARRYGAMGVGVELDSALVALSRRRAEEAGVGERVRFVQGDLFDADLRPATVLALYLTTWFNLRLRPKILQQLRPGSRVVTHVFDMGQWQADTVVHRIEHGAFIYRYTVPADVEGTWRVGAGPGAPFTLELDQKFQELRPRTARGDGPSRAPGLRDGVVDGDTVRLTLTGLAGRAGGVRLTGTVEGDRIAGRTEEGLGWSATRIERGEGSLERWETEDGGSPGRNGRGGAGPGRGGEAPARAADGRGAPFGS